MFAATWSSVRGADALSVGEAVGWEGSKESGVRRGEERGVTGWQGWAGGKMKRINGA